MEDLSSNNDPTLLDSTPILPVSSPTPKSPYRIIITLLILVLVGLCGYLSFQVYRLNRIVQVDTTIPPLPNPESPPADSTTNWKTYTNKANTYSLNYSPFWTIKEIDDSITEFTTQNNNFIKINIITDNSSTITEYLIKSDKISKTAYEGQPSIEVHTTQKTQINGLNCIQREEYLLAADLTRFATYFKSGNHIVAIYLEAIPGNSLIADKQNYSNSLSTFKFTSNPSSNPTTSTQELPKIPIVSTSDWKTVSNDGITFKIPPGATCTNDVVCSEFSFPNIYQGKENPIPSRIFVKVSAYQGGSRREQYASIAPTTINDCKPKYVEALFGTVTALQIAIDGGWCQGGYAGDIVTVIGNKFVMIGGPSGLTYDDQGQIARWDIRDTIVSTLKSL